MKVENRKMKVGVLLVAILIFGFLGLYFYGGSGGGGSDLVAEAEQTFLFVNPAFAQSESTGTTFLEEEAGMSIYVNVGQSLDLSVAKTVYKTIEEETSDYIVGSFYLPNLPETEDVHGFVHKDGWIVVYYLKNEPISKIIDWNYYSANQLTKTKLQVGLEQMGNALGITVTNAKYYNFQYTYADKWMIIIESREGSGEDSFNLKIPGEFTVYERSWSHYAEYDLEAGAWGPAYFRIDGNIINQISYSYPYIETNYGELTAGQLSPDVFHTVSISGNGIKTQCGGVVLAYQEP